MPGLEKFTDNHTLNLTPASCYQHSKHQIQTCKCRLKLEEDIVDQAQADFVCQALNRFFPLQTIFTCLDLVFAMLVTAGRR
jgi:hypothetical protein